MVKRIQSPRKSLDNNVVVMQFTPLMVPHEDISHPKLSWLQLVFISETSEGEIAVELSFEITNVAWNDKLDDTESQEYKKITDVILQEVGTSWLLIITNSGSERICQCEVWTFFKRLPYLVRMFLAAVD